MTIVFWFSIGSTFSCLSVMRQAEVSAATGFPKQRPASLLDHHRYSLDIRIPKQTDGFQETNRLSLLRLDWPVFFPATRNGMTSARGMALLK